MISPSIDGAALAARFAALAQELERIAGDSAAQSRRKTAHHKGHEGYTKGMKPFASPQRLRVLRAPFVPFVVKRSFWHLFKAVAE